MGAFEGSSRRQRRRRSFPQTPPVTGASLIYSLPFHFLCLWILSLTGRSYPFHILAEASGYRIGIWLLGEATCKHELDRLRARLEWPGHRPEWKKPEEG